MVGALLVTNSVEKQLAITCESDASTSKHVTQLQVSNQIKDQIVTYSLAATDSSLAALGSWPGYLTPVFSPEVTSYNWMVSNRSDDEEFTLHLKPSGSAATIIVRWTDLAERVTEQVVRPDEVFPHAWPNVTIPWYSERSDKDSIEADLSPELPHNNSMRETAQVSVYVTDGEGITTTVYMLQVVPTVARVTTMSIDASSVQGGENFTIIGVGFPEGAKYSVTFTSSNFLGYHNVTVPAQVVDAPAAVHAGTMIQVRRMRGGCVGDARLRDVALLPFPPLRLL
jgi:hypothetical protein